EAVLRVHEGDVVHQEHIRLGDPRQVLPRRLGRGLAIAAAVERPRAAERAVPRAAPRQLGRGARVEDADEVLPPPTREVAGGREAVEVVEQRRRGAGAVARDDAGQALEPTVAPRLEEARRDYLALTADDAVERARGVVQRLWGDEGDAVAAREDERLGPAPPRLAREVDD